MPTLTSFQLAGKIEDGALGVLAASRSLRRLNFLSCPVTDVELAHFKGMTRLHYLNVCQTKATEDALKELAAALPRCTIRWGEDKVIEPSDAEFREAVRLLDRGGFVLTLRLPDGKDVQAKQPADLPDDPFVLTGITRDGAFSDEDVKRLEPLAGLTLLRVPGSTLTDAGLRSLRNHRKTLTVLTISMSGVTDEGLKNAAELTGLKLLDIDRTLLGDAGLEHLKGLAELRVLRAHNTNITDAGVKHLAGLRLTILFLDNTRISDESIEVLAGMKSLGELSLSGTRVTAAGVEKLRAELPKCKIHWEPPKKP